MIFANKEAEELFIEYNKEYGLQHVNSKKPITVEDLEILKSVMEKYEKECN